MANLVLPAAVLFAVVFLAAALRVVPENERLVITRLGRPLAVRGPGLLLALPFVDRTTRVRLDSEIPGWRSLPPERLNQMVRQRAGVGEA